MTKNIQNKYFGTDGIRGEVGVHPITPDFSLKLGYAAGKAFKKQWANRAGHPKVLVGKDTRISGYIFESALEAGFASAGVDVALLGPMPTPAIAYLTRTFHACAGVVVSASHNAYQDNGIKFFSATGHKLSDELQNAIEENLEYPISLTSADLGKATRVNDAQGRYIEHCKSSVSQSIDLSGMRIVLDCANGATYQVAPSVFIELGADVIVIGDEPDGRNINENCGSTYIKPLIKKVIEVKADIGIAFDGDGDRVIIVDEIGNIIDGDAILYLITQQLVLRNKKPAGVVGTVMTNMGTEKAIRDLGVDFKRADVGDRYVMEMLMQNKWVLGGESSGHIIYLGKNTTGDGIIAALQIVAAMHFSKSSLSKLFINYSTYPLKMNNVLVTNKHQIMSNETLIKAIDLANKDFADNGRVLVRASGTEEKVRVMIESKNIDLLEKHLLGLTELIKKLGINNGN